MPPLGIGGTLPMRTSCADAKPRVLVGVASSMGNAAMTISVTKKIRLITVHFLLL